MFNAMSVGCRLRAIEGPLRGPYRGRTGEDLGISRAQLREKAMLQGERWADMAPAVFPVLC